MNLRKKFNFYENSKYFLLADAILLIAGLIITLIFGFNVTGDVQSGILLLNSVLTIIITLAIFTVYIGLRYDFAKAFSLVLIAVHNILISLSIISIIRIPVSTSLLMALILTISLSAIFTLILTEKIQDANLRKVNFSELINTTISKAVKELAIIASIVVAMLLLMFLIPSENLMQLIRTMLVVVCVIIYTSIFISLPIWCYFSVRIKKIKRADVIKQEEEKSELEEE